MQCPLWSAPIIALLWTVAPHPVPMALAFFGVPLALIDLRYKRLPNALTFPLYPVLGVLLADEWRLAATGCLVFGGAHLAVRLVAPRHLGGGDVKLAGPLGAVLAVHGALAWGVVAASVVTLALGLVLRTREPPHGPGLLVIAWGVTAL